MNSILITGCSRGLGLGLIQELLDSDKPVKHIFATCRHPDKAKVTLLSFCFVDSLSKETPPIESYFSFDYLCV